MLFNLFSMGGGRIVQAALSFLTMTMLARALGVEQLGVYSIVMAVFAYGSHVSEFGLRSIIMREWNLPGAQGRKSVSLYFSIRLLAAIIVSVVAYLVALVFYPQHATLLGLVMISTLFIAVQLDWVLLVTERYLAASWVLVIRPIFYLTAVSLLLVVEQANLMTIVVAFVFSWGVLALGTWFIVGGIAPKFTQGQLSLKKAWYLLGEGWPILCVALVGQAVQNADLILVGSLYGAEHAGQYYLAGAITVAGLVFANAMAQISLGRMSKFIADKKEFSNQLKQDLRMVLWVGAVISIGLVFVAGPLITVVFGEDYKASAELLVYFVPYFFLTHITGVLCSCIVAIGRQRQLFYINVLRAFFLVLGLFVASHAENIGFIALTKSIVEMAIIIIIIIKCSYGYFRGAIKVVFLPALLVFVSLMLYLVLFEWGCCVY